MCYVLGGLDKKTQRKGGQVQHTTKNKCCTLKLWTQKTRSKGGTSATHNRKQIALCIGTLDTKKHKAKGASATHNKEKKHIAHL
jgi:hypothetical protein